MLKKSSTYRNANLLAMLIYAGSALLLFCFPSALSAAEPAEVSGTIQLPSDPRHTLWIPNNYQHRGSKVDVLVNFHSSVRQVAKSVEQAGLNCVVINIQYGGLSSVYRKPFSKDRELFGSILAESLQSVRTRPRFPQDADWDDIAVSSFSAGFGAVREILKTQEYFDRIAAILMIDSLYCGYVGDGTPQLETGVVHPGLMKDFLRFAQAGKLGEKRMIVTHCKLPTPGYASTLETADYLLAKLGIMPTLTNTLVKLPTGSKQNARPLRLYRTASQRGFSLFGSSGDTGAEHVAHLTRLPHWLPKLGLDLRESREN